MEQSDIKAKYEQLVDDLCYDKDFKPIMGTKSFKKYLKFCGVRIPKPIKEITAYIGIEPTEEDVAKYNDVRNKVLATSLDNVNGMLDHAKTIGIVHVNYPAYSFLLVASGYLLLIIDGKI